MAVTLFLHFSVNGWSLHSLFTVIVRWQMSIKYQQDIVPQNIKHEKKEDLGVFALTICAVTESV